MTVNRFSKVPSYFKFIFFLIFLNITGYFYGANEASIYMFTSGCFTKSGSTYSGNDSSDHDNSSINFDASRV